MHRSDLGGTSRSRRRAALWGALLALLALLLPALAPADKVTLRNGRVIEGKVLDEDDKTVRIETGTSTLSFPKAQVLSVERGFSLEFVQSEVRKSVTEARAQAAAQNRPRALQIIAERAASLDAMRAAGQLGDEDHARLSGELAALRAELTATRTSADDAQAEYDRALALIDRVEYPAALMALNRAAELAPDREEVQRLRAETAVRVRDNDSAIDAFEALVRLAPAKNFDLAAPKLAELLGERSRRLLAEDRAPDAVATFVRLLEITGDTGGAAITYAEFQERAQERSAEDEADKLLRVYDYADSRDLVDLALASIQSVESLRPGDARVRQLREEASFFDAFRRRIRDGKLEEAYRLAKDAPASLRDSAAAQERLARIAGDSAGELEAADLLAQAREALAARRFDDAAARAMEYLERFADSPGAEEARQVHREATVEAPVSLGLVKARMAIAATEFDEAEAELRKLIDFPRLAESKDAKTVEELAASIPAERSAMELWIEAQAKMAEELLEETLAILRRIVEEFRGTVAGLRASEWLAEHERRIDAVVRRESMLGEGLFASLADPELWGGTVKRSRTALGGERSEIDRDSPAWERFEVVTLQDEENQPDTRSALLLVVLPLLLGAWLVGSVAWHTARPGDAVLPEADETVRFAGEEVVATMAQQHDCRMCGLALGAEDRECKHCGAPTQLSEVEKGRELENMREADFDPWDSRLTLKSKNDFVAKFEKAMDMVMEERPPDECIRAVQMAIQEDPRRVEAWSTLAALYEQTRERAKEAECYREILLIDPANVIVRQKIESVLSLSSAPLDLGRLPIALSGLLWWYGYFVTVSLDPQMHLARAVLAVIGAGLSVVLWRSLQKHRTIALPANKRPKPDHHHPLPKGRLPWSAMNRQAQRISWWVRDHTGVEVPVISTWRLLFALGISLVLLAGLAALAWTQDSLVPLLAWPAGALLLLFLIEIYPMLLTAHVLLRHFMEEVSAPWADPHGEFVPKGHQAKGEFLVRQPSELPLRWVLDMKPYTRDRQGVLNALQQVLNRHWSCHRFYSELHIVRDMDMPYPAGMRTATSLTLGLTLVALAGALALPALAAQRERRYREAMESGFIELLKSDLAAAHTDFHAALALNPKAAAPALYLAHTFAAMGADARAESSFLRATSSGYKVAAANNDYGNFLQRLGRMRPALEQYQIALESEPENPDVLNNVGSAFFRLEQYSKAEEALKKAVAIEQRHTRAWTTLGLTYERLGEREKARQSYQRAVEVAPEAPYTQVARDRLALDVAPEEGLPELGPLAER
ncbi:MAG: tetratricopeptide repeat protein [Candidatus Sumerlaeia bacterium]|nr:tetratricopeptide repeat protein [Candidatus Sumerlaeia bacterium]